MTNLLQNNIENKEEIILESIKNIILKKNDWMAIQEIADILGVERQQQLFEAGHNSTIAQLINRYFKKQGFKTQKINFADEGYSIWVCAPTVPENNLESVLK